MPSRIRLRIEAPDPVSQAGLVSQLRSRPGLAVCDDTADLDVALLSLDGVDDEVVRRIRALQRDHRAKVVVLVGAVDECALFRLVEEGVVGVIRRCDASAERLADAIASAHSGDGSIPADLLGSLLRQVHQIQQDHLAPRGLQFNGLSRREADVLRLVADGMDTREIADTLCYSPRTIKNVIHDVVGRFGLRNRSHAVAFAVRQGFI